MKTNIKYILLSFIAALLLFSCNSLDQEPTDKITDAKFWSSEKRAQQVLNMAYNQMYKRDKMWLDEELSDNMVNLRGTPFSLLVRTGQANSSTTGYREEWKWFFEGIKTCNVFMANIDLVPDMDVDVKKRMIAEIRFIRASLFFRMSNFYGDIPFFLNDITVAESKQMSRTSRATVLEELHKELDEVIPDLPKRDDLAAAENGRITKAAAMLLKARMYMQDYKMNQADRMAEVKKICYELIFNQAVYGTYALFTDKSKDPNYSTYENLFTSANEYNKEVILDYSYLTVDKEWEMRNLVPASVPGFQVTGATPTQSLVNDYIMLDGSEFDPKKPVSEHYKDRDPRLAATIVYHGYTWWDKDDNGNAFSQEIKIDHNSGGSVNQINASNATMTGYYTRKHFDPNHRPNLKMHNNAIMMRYADVLLLYAEACAEDGTLNQSVWNQTIRPIRERAGFTKESALNFPNGASKDELKKIVKRERRCELAIEGQRYWDILRWGEADKYLSGNVLGAKFANNGNDFVVVSSWVFTDKDKVWPVPQSEIDIVPTLKPQNAGY